MAFRDLDEFFDDHLTLPWRGTDYRVPPASAEVGIRVEALVMQGGRLSKEDIELLSDGEETDLYAKLLGPVWQQLQDDGASWPVVQHFGRTAMVWVALGKEAAEAAWEGKPMPTPPPPEPTNRAGRRHAAKAAPSTSTGAARATRARASTSGTKSQPKTNASSARARSATTKS